MKNGLYVSNDKMSIRSKKIGNAYLNPEIHIKKDATVISGKEASYFGALAPSESLALQGSTRVLTRSSNFNDIDINSTALSNISSLTDEQMIKNIEKENARRLEKNPDVRLLNIKSVNMMEKFIKCMMQDL